MELLAATNFDANRITLAIYTFTSSGDTNTAVIALNGGAASVSKIQLSGDYVSWSAITVSLPAGTLPTTEGANLLGAIAVVVTCDNGASTVTEFRAFGSTSGIGLTATTGLASGECASCPTATSSRSHGPVGGVMASTVPSISLFPTCHVSTDARVCHACCAGYTASLITTNDQPPAQLYESAQTAAGTSIQLTGPGRTPDDAWTGWLSGNLATWGSINDWTINPLEPSSPAIEQCGAIVPKPKCEPCKPPARRMLSATSHLFLAD